MSKRRFAIFLLGIGTLSALLAASSVGSPGYMDADYYYSMGIQWSRGTGSEEPFLWNYLNHPTGIPTTSHTYWSPLVAMITGMSMRFFGESFRSAQVPFILFTALLPFTTWQLARVLKLKESHALFAGMLAIASGFFLPFFVTTDAFSLYALIGALLLLVSAYQTTKQKTRGWIVAGILTGLAHLSRADGFLFLIIPGVCILLQRNRIQKSLLALGVGYIALVLPWFYHQHGLTGSILGSGTSRVLWLTAYNDLFSYPAELLSAQRWWESGLDQILIQRWRALWTITERVIAENGLVFLLPFMVIGIIRNWKVPWIRGSVAYLAGLFVLMALVFPEAGARGGWFHSSAAVMPLLWVMVPAGLTATVSWVGGRRGWDLPNATRVFAVLTIVLALVLTWGLYLIRVVGLGGESDPWNSAFAQYQDINQAILERDIDPGVVATNNPPGIYHISGINSVVIPAGGVQTLKAVTETFGVRWIVLDQNHPAELTTLYRLDEVPPWLSHEVSFQSHGNRIVLFRVMGD
jgi:hypothetical protein